MLEGIFSLNIWLATLVLTVGLVSWPFLCILLAVFCEIVAPNMLIWGKPISLWVILTCLFSVAVRPACRARFRTLPRPFLWLLLTTFLFCLAWNLSNYLHGTRGLDLGSLTKIALTLCIVAVIDTRARFELFLRLICWAVAASVIVGIFQFVGLGWAFRLATSYQDLPAGIIFRPLYRIAGLSLDQINLADHLALTFPFALFFMIHRKGKADIALFVILAMGILLNGTRSVLLSFALVSAFMFLAYGRRSFQLKLGYSVIIFCVLSVICFSQTIAELAEQFLGALNPFFIFEQDISMLTRILRYKYSMQLFLENPLSGVGPHVLPDQLRALSLSGYYIVGSSHNEILKILASLGVIGGLLLTLFYRNLGQLILTHCRKLEAWTSDLARFLGISLFCCFLHSLFHNSGFWASSRVPWYFIGILGALATLEALKEQTPGRPHVSINPENRTAVGSASS